MKPIYNNKKFVYLYTKLNRFFEKKVFGGCKSQIVFIGDQNAGRGDRIWRLKDVAKGTETVLQGLDVILQIWRLGAHFCGAHGASAPPPALN